MRVLHVLPIDTARGAQVFARALVDRAHAATDDRHELAVIFAGDPVVLGEAHRLQVPVGRARQWWVQPAGVRALRALVRRVAPDVIVAHGAEPMKYAAWARRHGTPLVCHAIGVASPAALAGPRHALYARLFASADLLVGVSTAVAEQHERAFGLSPERVRVIPNGRDPQQWQPLPRATGESVPTLAFVGHLTRTKRPEVFLDVVERLRARGVPVRPILVGDGPLESQLRAPAARVQATLLGRREDVPELLGRADVLVFTSEPENEGMPGVLIEAGLCGVPVVTTAVPGAEDVVLDGRTGAVHPVDDVAGLADSVEALLRDPELRARQGRDARRHCTEHFALDRVTATWVSTLHELAESAR